MACEMKDFSKIKPGDTLILRNGGRETCTSVGSYIHAKGGLWRLDGFIHNEETTGFDIIDYEPAPEKEELSPQFKSLEEQRQVVADQNYHQGYTHGYRAALSNLAKQPALEREEYNATIYWVKRLVDGAIQAQAIIGKGGFCIGSNEQLIAITPVTFKEGDGLES